MSLNRLRLLDGLQTGGFLAAAGHAPDLASYSTTRRAYVDVYI